LNAPRGGEYDPNKDLTGTPPLYRPGHFITFLLKLKPETEYVTKPGFKFQALLSGHHCFDVRFDPADRFDIELLH